LDLVGTNNNPCTSLWLSSGFASCNPCDYDGIECAPRDLPKGNQCSCNDDGGPRPTPSPVTVPPPTFSPPTTAVSPTPSPVVVVSFPTKVPTPEPTSGPNVSSDDQKCSDDPSFLFKNKKNCKWVEKKQTNKRCNKKWKDKKVSKWCPATCGYCPGGCTNCDVKPLYKMYNKKGYCDHPSDKETNKKVSKPEQCWEQCKKEYNRVYAEFTDVNININININMYVYVYALSLCWSFIWRILY
jgi:hypothetical protein